MTDCGDLVGLLNALGEGDESYATMTVTGRVVALYAFAVPLEGGRGERQDEPLKAGRETDLRAICMSHHSAERPGYVRT